MRWSLSKLGTFTQCGAKYKFKYIEKAVEQRSLSASRGVDHHTAVERFLKSEIAELPQELSFYTQFLTEVRGHEIYPEHKIALTKDWTPTTWDAEDVWYTGILDLKLLLRSGNSGGNSEEHQGEQSAVPATDGKGEPTEAVIYDWKTGKIYPDHDDQKSIYSVAVYSEHPTVQSVRAMHVYLDLGKVREKEFHREQMHMLRKSWEDRVAPLERANPDDLIPNPGFHCRWCGFSRAKGGPCKF